MCGGGGGGGGGGGWRSVYGADSKSIFRHRFNRTPLLGGRCHKVKKAGTQYGRRAHCKVHCICDKPSTEQFSFGVCVHTRPSYAGVFADIGKDTDGPPYNK